MTLKPDIAVLQETNAAIAGIPDCLWIGGIRKKGLAVVTKNGYRAELIPQDEKAPWSIAPVNIRGPNLSLHLLAVWARKEADYITGVYNAIVSSYPEFLRAQPSVVIGDFNANKIWDEKRSVTNFSNVAKKLETEFGLVSAYHKSTGEDYGKESQRTLNFRWNKERQFHIDYCFVPQQWKIEKVMVEDTDAWTKLSDHKPLVVEVTTD